MSTTVHDTTGDESKSETRDYKTFLMRRSAWLKEHSNGIDEVKALKNIFYSFLFAVR
jgi:hypothetical protein